MNYIFERLSIPERTARYLSAMSAAVAGQRGHSATYAAAHAVTNGFALGESTALAALLLYYNTRCLPPWTEAELLHKVRSALANPGLKGRGYLLNHDEALPSSPPPAARPIWPKANPARIAPIMQEGPSVVGLTLLSPGPLDEEDAGRNAAPIVQALFADADVPNPLLCIGKSSHEFATRPLSGLLKRGLLANCQFIVPARMTARTGKTKTGKESEHTLDNTGARRFVVVEFDTGTADEHAARLWHLAGYAPLALVVHSGGKSLHGWFSCHGQAEGGLHRFMRYAASLGADPALFRNRSQFVRMPGGTRVGGCRQSVFYYAPDALVSFNPEVN